jgi:hypothetical protein
LIKGLYNLGRVQSEDQGPLSVAAILTFHDALELWLRLASEHLDVVINSQDLMQYWDTLGNKLGSPLPGKERMRRLNKARVNLKHYGIMPSTQDVHELRDATASFLQEATSQVFQLSFTDLSLIDLVADKQIASLLMEASEGLKACRLKDAMDALAKGFYCLRTYLGDDIVRVPGRPPIHVYRRSPPRFRRADREGSLPDYAEHVERSIDELRSRVSMLELGVDMSRFRRFSPFVPEVMQTGDGKLHVMRGPSRPALEANEDEARQCFDFLLDTAVRLSIHMEPTSDVDPSAAGGA